ncbi:MAG: hypothetical protein JSS50_03495 [Proteobacteria bacterium]|nr:hypothetical protein [Pseudomonadota bacterium]
MTRNFDIHDISNQISLLEERLAIDEQSLILWGAEIEFYLRHTSDGEAPNVDEAERFTLKVQESAGILVEKEKGLGQYELVLPPATSAVVYSEYIARCKMLACDVAASQGLITSFAPKPYQEDHGSGLHIHLNFCDKNDGRNLYSTGQYAENRHLMVSIYGILAKLEAEHDMLISAKDKPRLLATDRESVRNIPAGLCWGGNNRTTAIRIPDNLPIRRRLELRVPSADSCPYSVLLFMLDGIDSGLRAEHALISHALKYRYPRIYGNAFEQQYPILRFQQLLEEHGNAA